MTFFLYFNCARIFLGNWLPPPPPKTNKQLNGPSLTAEVWFACDFWYASLSIIKCDGIELRVHFLKEASKVMYFAFEFGLLLVELEK